MSERPPATVAGPGPAGVGSSRRGARRGWRRFVRHPAAVVGASVLAIAVAAALFAPQLAPYPPDRIDFLNPLKPPSAQFWLGTDSLGRDVLSRIVYGARISLLVGVVAVGIAVTIGTPLGLVAGFFGGWVDALIMRVVDMFQAFPVVLLAIAIMAVLGPSAFNVMIALGLVGWTQYARLVRGIVLTARESDYVTAAHALGARSPRVVLRHLLPNAVPPIIVLATFGIADAIVVEASLSFLGLGVQPPTPSWGGILSDGRGYIRQAGHIAFFPGIAIVVTILGLNFLGDGLRDSLDPKAKR